MAVVGFGGVTCRGGEAVEAGLSSAGIAVVDAVGEASLVVAVTDDYLRGGLAELNAAALVSGQPWLLVRPGGRQCWLGPLMRPGQSACWECLAQRLRANRDVERFVGRRRGTAEPFPPPLGVVPAVTADAVVALVVLEVLKVVGGAAVTVDGRVVTLEWPTLERAEHVVVRRPQCPACGDPSPAAPQPVEVESQPKGWFVDGGHRTRSPHDTWTSYQHHISPITGAVSGVDEISPKARLYVYSAGPNMAMPADTIGRLRGGLRSRSAGKGRSQDQARCSALCEALERYSGRFDGTEARRRGSYRQLGELAIHPNACMLWSDAQYDDAERWNASHPALHNRVPARFDENALVDWTPVVVAHQRHRQVPPQRVLLLRPRRRGERAVLPRGLQRQRRRHQPHGSDPAGLPRAGRAGRRRDVVVPPPPAAGRRSRQHRRSVRRRSPRPVRRAAS